ncbi:MAG: hypothetical protein HQ575_02830 [Candidatus Omnitrophica bacterium]|nr:hypothetical protein [Candidatus Omnitrophota bacterium]
MVNQMRFEAKKDRQKRVLDMIVRYHTSTTEPVGSGMISKEMGLSSATIRNIMSELEELDLIRQPHTSAGRIPTDKGYRFFVNSLMETSDFSERLNYDTDEQISLLRSSSLEDVISKALHLCSMLTAQAGVAFFPSIEINEERSRFYFDGAHYLAEHPEFRDISKICSVLRILEERDNLLEILMEDVKDSGIKLHIGSENKITDFKECTIITANYSIDEDVAGTLGVIGPMRMEYEKVIPTLSSITDSISRLLEEMI